MSFWLAKRGLWFWFINLFGSALLAYLAYLADVASKYAPFSYGVIALAAFMLISAGYAVYSWGRAKYYLAEFEDRRSKSTAVNPLAKQFQRLRISAIDFYHPYFIQTRAALFENCEIYGPAHLFISGSIFNGISSFEDCDCVVINKKVTSKTATAFEGCVFESCRFYRILFLTTAQQYRDFVAAGVKLNLIAGDLPANEAA